MKMLKNYDCYITKMLALLVIIQGMNLVMCEIDFFKKCKKEAQEKFQIMKLNMKNKLEK